MTCLAYAFDTGKHITQLDISSAYLYADLEEKLYIRAPHMNLKNKVMPLKKSLYGLKLSGSNWHNTIRTYLVNVYNLDELKLWLFVFVNKKLVLCLFVDDMVVISGKELVEELQRRFDRKVENNGIPDDNTQVVQYDILGMQIDYEIDKSLKISYC